MLYAIESMLHFSKSSSVRAQNTLVKALYLKRLLKLIATNPAEITGRFESLRKELLQFSNLRVFVIADVEKLSKPASSWSILADHLDANQPLKPIDSKAANLSDAGRHPGSLAFISPMAPIDSSFLLLTARGVDSYDHPKLPALMVAIAYLEAVEGPLWVAVRGTGLAYGTSFARSTDTGALYYQIYRSPDAFKAYKVSRQVVEEYISGERKFEKYALEGAISSIVMSFADEQPTMASAATCGFVNQVIKGIEKNWSDKMLPKVRAIQVEDIQEVLRDIVRPLFQPGKADLIVTCATIMQENLAANFADIGFRPRVEPLAFFQDDYGLAANGDDDDHESDEDSNEITDDDEGDNEDGEIAGNGET
jgi:Zn-dependent M16 (insulinase) family peptidase